jgi:predicted nucleic acid-binding protein
MTLVDSNVLLDVFSAGQPWVAWSKQQLEHAVRRGPVSINDVIYAEISLQFAAFDALDAALKEILIDVVPMPRPALFLAGRAFRQYRTGGLRTGVLSDFFIGAHATVQHLPIVTRDVRRYRHYFPSVELIAPAFS